MGLTTPRPSYGIGDYVPQTGPMVGAYIKINGQDNIAQPTNVRYVPPKMVGRNLMGRPIYQGMPTVELEWDSMEMDSFQAISVEFFESLNTPEGPIVDVVWPSPYEAGRFLTARAYLEWPAFDGWKELYLQGIKVTLSMFSLPGQGINNRMRL